jgi:hypothetical protein
MYLKETGHEDVDVIHLTLEIVPGSCEHNNAISVSIKSDGFLDHLGVYQFKKKISSTKFSVCSLNTNNIRYYLILKFSITALFAFNVKCATY